LEQGREANAEAIAAALARRLSEAPSPTTTEPRKRRSTSKGIAPATMAAHRAFLFYERHVGIKEPITASKLALEVALYAVENELRGADLLVATNATMQDLAREALETLRHPVKLD
jgi:hypothetical protein